MKLMECHRIFKNRKTIILVFVLLLFNGLWYLYQQHNTWKNFNISITQASTMQKEYLTSLKGLSVKNQLRSIEKEKDNLSKSMDQLIPKKSYSNTKLRKLMGQNYILEGLEKQVTYISNYHKKIERVAEQAQLMSTISIFQKEDSFSQDNINKTVKDYRSVSDIQLSNSVNQPVKDTFFDPILQYLNIIFIIFMVLSFIEERKIGLWEKVHSTPNGRTKLALKRVFILLNVSIIFQFIMVSERFLISSILYGNPDIFRLVQSVPEFVKFVYPVNILEYLIIYCFICSLCCFCFGLFTWLLLLIFHSPIISIFVLCIVTVCEWMINFFLPSQSIFSLFKYLNCYYFLSPAKDLAEYCNINLFGIVANRFIVVIVSLIMVSIGIALLLVLLAERVKPIRIPGLLDRIWKKCATFCGNIWRRLLAKRSGLFFETYKTFFSYKGYIIILVLIVYLLSSFETYQLSFTADDIVQNKFYEEYGGPITKKNLQKYLEIKEKVSHIESDLKKAEEDFSNQKITAEQLSDEKIEYTNSSGIISLENKLTQDYQRLKQIEKKNHNTPWFNNTTGLESMFHGKTELNRLFRIELSVLIMILLVSFSYSIEQKSAVKDKLRTTVNGRENLFHKKLAMNCLICFLVAGIVWAYDYIYYAKIFPMGSLFAPIQTLQTLGDIPFRCNVLTFLIFLFLIRWILLCNVSFFVSYLSSKFTTIATIIISFLIFLVPSLFAIIGIRLFKIVAIIDSMTIIPSIINKNFAFDIKFKIVALLVFGILGILLCYRQWCKKGVGYETRN